MARYVDDFKALLIKHEGIRLKAYVDTAGKITIGVGRNLTDVGISQAEAMSMLDSDINAVAIQVAKLPWFTYISSNRQLVIMSMAYNLGIGGLLEFKQMINAIINADYMRAADEMLASQWAKQVGQRAIELTSMMRLG